MKSVFKIGQVAPIKRLSASAFPFGLLACLLLAPDRLSRPAEAADPPARDAGVAFFESKVRPILFEHCFKCHGPDSEEGEGELRVDSLESLLRGGSSGPAIVRGDPGRSLLIRAVRHDGPVAMPPKKKLADNAINALSAWVKMGAPWPGLPEAAHGRPRQTASPLRDQPAREYWAFQVPRHPGPPMVAESRWPLTPIDLFVLAKLEAAGMHPAPPAGKRTLLRRATLDLWGIPPSPEELDAFLHDETPAPSSASSTGCLRPRTTGNAGDVIGWISRATPTATGWTTTSPTPTPGATGIM